MSTGDRIGVIFNRAERTIAYYKNGISLGVAFRDVQEEVLYPAVGLRTPGEEVMYCRPAHGLWPCLLTEELLAWLERPPAKECKPLHGTHLSMPFVKS